MAVQQEELSELRMEAEALRDRQVEGNRQQVELEAELQQLRAELSRQVTMGQVTQLQSHNIIFIILYYIFQVRNNSTALETERDPHTQ